MSEMTLTIDGHDWTMGELRSFAFDLREQHNPANQSHQYERCEHCHYTRHPCDIYDLASIVLALLDRP